MTGRVQVHRNTKFHNNKLIGRISRRKAINNVRTGTIDRRAKELQVNKLTTRKSRFLWGHPTRTERDRVGPREAIRQGPKETSVRLPDAINQVEKIYILVRPSDEVTKRNNRNSTSRGHPAMQLPRRRRRRINKLTTRKGIKRRFRSSGGFNHEGFD